MKPSIKVRHVLDASALLALVKGEPGAEIVEDAIGSCAMSAVNLSECVATLCVGGVAPDVAIRSVGIFNIEVLSFDEDAALASAAMRLPTIKQGLSLGDRACLALARKLTAPVLTADKIWAKFDLGIEIKVIR